MDITMQLLGRQRSANWRVDVDGPCSEPGVRLSESIGTDGGYHDPKLQIHNGRFRLRRHTFVPGDHSYYRYTLNGHATHGGFAGTFTFSQTTETSGYTSVTCSVPLLHWRAQRSKRPFP